MQNPPKAPTLALNDGNDIPQIGAGTWPLNDTEARRVVREAILVGYRHIDTAAAYDNEEGVGAGIRDAGIPREELFVTTKIGNGDHGRKATRRALEASLQRLRVDRVDLALIHWPMPALDLYAESWQALIELRDEGKTTSIGVSNFRPEHLDRIIASGVTPAVDQIEINPVVQHAQLRGEISRRGILAQSWSPLGPGTGLLSEPLVREIAQRLDVTPAQVVLRWHIEQRLVAIPKAGSAERLRENLSVFGFSLEQEDLAALDSFAQDSPARYAPHLAGD